jgi:hypothetical protein
MDIEKIRRLHRAKEQRIHILRGERFIPLRDLTAGRIVRIADYKARKARQAVWENESK